MADCPRATLNTPPSADMQKRRKRLGQHHFVTNRIRDTLAKNVMVIGKKYSEECHGDIAKI